MCYQTHLRHSRQNSGELHRLQHRWKSVEIKKKKKVLNGLEAPRRAQRPPTGLPHTDCVHTESRWRWNGLLKPFNRLCVWVVFLFFFSNQFTFRRHVTRTTPDKKVRRQVIKPLAVQLSFSRLFSVGLNKLKECRSAANDCFWSRLIDGLCFFLTTFSEIRYRQDCNLNIPYTHGLPPELGRRSYRCC